MYLKQRGFTYSACGPFTKNKARIQKFKETGDSQYVYQNVLDKVCLQHHITFNIAKNPKYDEDQRGLASMVDKFFVKKTWVSGFESVIMPNQELDKELKKQLLKDLKNVKYNNHLNTIFGVLILQVWN